MKLLNVIVLVWTAQVLEHNLVFIVVLVLPLFVIQVLILCASSSPTAPSPAPQQFNLESKFGENLGGIIYS